MQEIKNIFVVGGGTAGYVIPAIQLSRELIKNYYKVIFMDNKYTKLIWETLKWLK